jgi:hypothetical protein
MQFTTRISEQDFFAANRLASKSVYQTVAFAFIYVLFSLLLLIHLSAVMDKHPGANNAFAAEDIERGTVIEKAILVPEALCFGCLFMFKVVAPLKIRRLYRRDMSQRERMLLRSARRAYPRSLRWGRAQAGPGASVPIGVNPKKSSCS